MTCSCCRSRDASAGASTHRSCRDPLDNQPWEQHRDAVAEQAQDEPLIDCVLEPGDALYLPRGTIHAAEALGETSIHLTVGVHPVTRYQLVRQLLDAVQDEPALRASLPMGVDLSDPEVLAPQLAATVQALADRLAATGADTIAQRIGDRLMNLHPSGADRAARAVARRGVRWTGETALRLRSGLRLPVRRGRRPRHADLPRPDPDAAGRAPPPRSRRCSPARVPAGRPARPRRRRSSSTLARRLLREGVIVRAPR